MKLTWRIQLLVFIIISFSTLATSWLTTYQASTLHKESEKLLATTLVNALRDAIVQDVINNNRLRVTNILKNIVSKNSPIEYLFISTNKQRVFAHSFKNGFPSYLLHDENNHNLTQATNLIRKYQTRKGLIFEYSVAMIPGLEMNIHIGMNQSVIADQFNQNYKTIFFLSLFIMTLSIIVAVIWSRSITRPLSIFSQQIQRFGIGKKLDFSKMRSSSPEILYLVETMQVASEERQKAINVALEREQNLAITLNSIGDAVITTDKDGMVNRINPVAENLTGWRSIDAIGSPLSDIFLIIDATTRQPIENPIDKVLKTGKIVYLSNHTTLVSRDGTEYQIADSAAPIRDDEKNITGIVLVFNDITEQYRLREEAIRSRNDLQSIMDHAPAVITVKNTRGEYTFVNQKFTRLFHTTQEDVLGKTHFDIFPAEIAEEIQRNDVDVIETDLSLDAEEQLPHDDVVHSYISTRFPLRDSDNKTYALCTISTDITERKHKDQQLRHSQKMDALGKLTGGIAHDFNNMLGVILGYSELLSHELKNSDKLVNYVSEIHRAGERGAKLTKKLLAFSRQKVAAPKVYDINNILIEQKHMLEKTLTARIQLKYELAKHVWPVLIDSNDLIDAVVNISINAMHAIQGNGKLTIKTYDESVNETDAVQLQIPPGDYVLLSLTDTGKGMDTLTLERIFDPFFTTKGDRGTGLGLSQVYGFVERSHGTIKVYSEVDHGTRVTLYFPRSQSNSKKQGTVLEKDSGNNSLKGSETVLIVDDEPSLLQLTASILTAQGYKTLTAGNGKEALEVLENEKVDLVLSDVIMPEMDGYELATIIQEKYPAIKIQMASGFSDDRHENMIDESLHKNLLHKPYHSITLLKRIRELLQPTH